MIRWGFLFWSTEMQRFTPFQRSKLLANRNVEDVTEKSVQFTSKFKIKAVQQYLDGMKPDEIFESAGIPVSFFKARYCGYCLKRWFQKFKGEGKESLKEDNRGWSGRPVTENLNDLTYEELLALVEIHKEALEEVKKQNALARKKKF